jgi:hypothetical protein
VPPSRHEFAACQPVQLDFDWFPGGFNRHFAADALNAFVRPARLRINLLVLLDAQVADTFLMMDAMRAECLRLSPTATVVLADGADVRRAHADRTLAELGESNLLLLHQLADLPDTTSRTLQAVIGNRLEKCLLTVLALRSSPEYQLQHLCTLTCASGLSVQLLPPEPAPRRGILLRHMSLDDGRVDTAAIATRTSVPWESASDVGALGQRLLHAAYSPGKMLTAEMVGMLGDFLGKHPSDTTSSNPPRCCRNRLHWPLPRGHWQKQADDDHPANTTIENEFKHACVTVEMRQRIWPERLRLDLRSDHEGRVPARFEIDISLRPRFAVRVRSARNWTSHGWGLTAGLPRVAKDPFREARQWTYRALVQVLPRKSRDAPYLRLRTRWIDPVLAKTLRAVRAKIRQAAVAAAALLDSDARKTALQFPNHMRVWLYRHLAADTSGRLAQLAQVCPGALTFAYALAAFGRSHVCGRAVNSCAERPQAAPLANCSPMPWPRGLCSPNARPRICRIRTGDDWSGRKSPAARAMIVKRCCKPSACSFAEQELVCPASSYGYPRLSHSFPRTSQHASWTILAGSG